MTDKFAYYQMGIDDLLAITELAKKHGKKAGDSMLDELHEYMKSKEGNVECLGTGDKDIDLITGDLRESGKKVLNFNELERRKQ